MVDIGAARCDTQSMPTALPRTTITHVPRVERILAAGGKRWPDAPPREVLLNLAEERVTELDNGRPIEEPRRVTTYAHFLSVMRTAPFDDGMEADIGRVDDLFVEGGVDPWEDD